MSFIDKILGGIPTIPPASQSDKVVDWFFKYDPKITEILTLVGNQQDLIDDWKHKMKSMLNDVENSSHMISLLQWSVDNHYKISGMISVLSPEERNGDTGFGFFTTLLRFNSYMRVFGYISSRRFNIDANDISPSDEAILKVQTYREYDDITPPSPKQVRDYINWYFDSEPKCKQLIESAKADCVFMVTDWKEELVAHLIQADDKLALARLLDDTLMKFADASIAYKEIDEDTGFATHKVKLDFYKYSVFLRIIGNYTKSL